VDRYGRRRQRTRSRKGRTGSLLLLDLVAAVLALAGFASLGSGRVVEGSSPSVRVSGALQGSTTSATRSVRAAQGAPSAEVTAVPRATPLHLSIPAIGVDTTLVRLGLNPDDTLQVPADFAVAGWFALGPSPGEQGAAVIAGHVDSKRGPAVFFRLGELDPGALVRVVLGDRTELLFRVYAVREYPKTAFPTSLVYAATPGPELRLVTCGGPFDAHTGHYLDNVVVFARFSGPDG
jgi:sortase (surface protein transpeptidase)